MSRRPPLPLVAGFSGGAFVLAFALYLKSIGFGSTFTSSSRFGDLIVDGQLTALAWLDGLVVASVGGLVGAVAGVVAWRWFVRGAGGE